jgi:mono/diheme cytochrome c family protein
MKQLSIAIILTASIGLLSFGLQQPNLKASMDRGKKVYMETCAACHLQDGKGLQGLNPPLIKTKQVSGAKPQLITIVLKGMEQELTINGETYYNPMPGQSNLTDLQIADVLTYVRNSFGNKYSLVTAAEVKAIRAKLK